MGITGWLSWNIECLELGNASSMAGCGSFLLLCFLFPDLANILCYSCGIWGCTREPSPCEPNCIEPTISFPPIWEWCPWKPILGEKFTFLYITKAKTRLAYLCKPTKSIIEEASKTFLVCKKKYKFIRCEVIGQIQNCHKCLSIWHFSLDFFILFLKNQLSRPVFYGSD